MQGITDLGESFLCDVDEDAAAQSLGTWSNGESFGAVKNGAVGINIYPGASRAVTGDFAGLLENAVYYQMRDFAASTFDVDDDMPTVGDTITFTLVIDMTCSSESALMIENPIPDGLTYVDASVTGGATYDDIGNTINYDGALTGGTPLTITYETTVDELAKATITNTATTTSGDTVTTFDLDVVVDPQDAADDDDDTDDDDDDTGEDDDDDDDDDDDGCGC